MISLANKPKLAIIGASGHAKVVAEIAQQLNDYSEIVFFDDAHPKEHPKTQGTISEFLQYIEQYQAIVAIGHNQTRLKFIELLKSKQANIATLIHPKAIIASNVKIAFGSVIMPGAVINSDAVIGEGVIVNSNAVVEHDCQLMKAVHISPGACLAGGVFVGECSWIGMGAVVNQLLHIGQDVIIGSGSVVTKDVDNYLVVVGAPARVLDKK